MELRFRLFLVSVVAIAAVAVWTFPIWRVYLRQPGDATAFPGLAMDLQAGYLALPAEEREALLTMRASDPTMALEMVLVAIAGPQPAPADDADDIEGARLLISGEFIRVDSLHYGAGSATVYELPDGRRILRFEAFSSTPGGDVRVYLARDPQPLTALEVGSDFHDLGQLKGNVGDQTYDLPVDINLNLYRSAVVYCRQFSAVITVATLR